MSAFDVRTISDKEAASRLGFPLRALRKMIDLHGYCLRLGNRRRLTEAHFLAVQKAMSPPDRAPMAGPRRASTLCRSPAMGSAMSEALAMAEAFKAGRAGRRGTGGEAGERSARVLPEISQAGRDVRGTSRQHMHVSVKP